MMIRPKVFSPGYFELSEVKEAVPGEEAKFLARGPSDFVDSRSAPLTN